MKELRIVDKVEIQWVGPSDRHIVVGTSYTGKIVGITYQQGYEMEGLLEIGSDGEYLWDEDLTKYVRWLLPKLTGASLIDRIDEAIWIYVSREMELHGYS